MFHPGKKTDPMFSVVLELPVCELFFRWFRDDGALSKPAFMTLAIVSLLE